MAYEQETEKAYNQGQTSYEQQQQEQQHMNYEQHENKFYNNRHMKKN